MEYTVPTAKEMVLAEVAKYKAEGNSKSLLHTLTVIELCGYQVAANIISQADNDVATILDNMEE
jgi:hypothetical protein